MTITKNSGSENKSVTLNNLLPTEIVITNFSNDVLKEIVNNPIPPNSPKPHLSGLSGGYKAEKITTITDKGEIKIGHFCAPNDDKLYGPYAGIYDTNFNNFDKGCVAFW